MALPDDEFVKLLASDVRLQSAGGSGQSAVAPVSAAPVAERFIVFEGWLQERLPGLSPYQYERRYLVLDNVGNLMLHAQPNAPPTGKLEVSSISGIRLPDQCTTELVGNIVLTVVSESVEETLRFVRAISLLKDRKFLSTADMSLLAEDEKLIHRVVAEPANSHPVAAAASRGSVAAAASAAALRDDDRFRAWSQSWDTYKQRSMLVRTLTKWLNYVLRRRSIVIRDIFTDFRDGVVLNVLVDLMLTDSASLRSDGASGAPPASPQRNVQKMILLNGALKRIRDSGNPFPIVPVEDIMSGKSSSTLSLLWALAWVFDVSSRRFEFSQGSEALLLWVAQRIEPLRSAYPQLNLSAENFSSAFQDGAVLCAILHSYNRQAVQLDTLNRHHVLENVQLALGVGERLFHVPKLLEPTDFLDEIDEKSVMLHVSTLFDKLHQEN